MIGALNLFSGSSGTFELYRLVLAYLHDYELRQEMNRSHNVQWIWLAFERPT